MRSKKLLIYIALIVAFTISLTMVPVQALFAIPEIVDLGEEDLDSHWNPCGTDEHYVKFDVQDCVQKYYRLVVDYYEPPGWNEDSRFYAIEFKNAAGNTRYRPLIAPFNNNVEFLNYRLWWVKWDRVGILEPSFPPYFKDLVWIKFHYYGNISRCTEKAEPEPEPMWERGDRDMVCSAVWVNDDNCFELVFIYEYADNNHVMIYDEQGNLVYETDMQYGNARIEVCLPDGMYKVMTYHDQPEPLQEFYIGKPVPEAEM